MNVNEELTEQELDESTGGAGTASAYAGVSIGGKPTGKASAYAGASANASARVGVTVNRPKIIIFAGIVY